MDIGYFRNPNTINVFSDASIKQVGIVDGKRRYHSCYGAVVVYGDQKMDAIYKVCSNSTNNDGEIKGIRSAVSLALRYRNYCNIINVFSDSQVSIFGIRDRIFQWENINDTICGYNQNPIANQSIYLEILDMITRSDIHINFWHQKGHVNSSNKESLNNAAHVFKSSNGIREEVDTNLIKYLARWNNEVDRTSRKVLHETDFSRDYMDALRFVPHNFYERLEKFESLGG